MRQPSKGQGAVYVSVRMRMKAGLLAFVVLSGLLAGPTLGVAAGDRVALYLEGKPLTAVGKLVYDVTMAPLEDLSTDLGFKMSGLSENRCTVTYKDKKVALNVGSNWATLNGHEVIAPSPLLKEDGKTFAPLRFLVESLGYRVEWSETGGAHVNIEPVVENSLIIGTVRERQETATFLIDIQYPKVVGLDLTVQGPMNAFFANRTSPAVEEGYENEKANLAAGHVWPPTEVFLNYRVAYNQRDLLCIVFDDYTYTGGAHGMTGRHGYTVDVKTGVSYALKDLFKPGTDYVSLLSAKVKEQIQAMELTTLGEFTKIRDDQDFYIQDDQLVIYFQQYELMAYAYGFPEFRVSLASLEDLLIPEMAARQWRAE